MDLKHYYSKVNHALEHLGIDPETAKKNENGQWDLEYGSISIFLDVFQLKGVPYFQCLSPMLKVPEKVDKKFFEELLELNHNFFSVSFTKYKDWIYLRFAREFEDLEVSEIIKIIKRIAVYADTFSQMLKNKYEQNSENTPDDALQGFYNNLLKENYDALKDFCDPEQTYYDDILKRICQNKEKDLFLNLKILSGLSYFTDNGVNYASMPVRIEEKNYNLIFVNRNGKWYINQFAKNN